MGKVVGLAVGGELIDCYVCLFPNIIINMHNEKRKKERKHMERDMRNLCKKEEKREGERRTYAFRDPLVADRISAFWDHTWNSNDDGRT